MDKSVKKIITLLNAFTSKETYLKLPPLPPIQCCFLVQHTFLAMSSSQINMGQLMERRHSHEKGHLLDGNISLPRLDIKKCLGWS